MDISPAIITIIVVFCISAFISIVLLLERARYYKKVENTSEIIAKLKDLNKNTKFNTFKRKYFYHEVCKSKKNFEKLIIDDFFVGFIEENYSYFNNIYTTVTHNHTTLKIYKDTYTSYISTITNETCSFLNLKIKKYRKIEQKIFKKHIINPILNIDIKILATYTSPAGKKYYKKEKSYNYAEFAKIFIKTEKLIKSKQTREFRIKKERAKLSDSVRYDVLRRDGFRCLICGATAQDGVKLHVDHIFPVSKGGLTEMSNLRTLCERCNLGKSDKIE